MLDRQARNGGTDQTEAEPGRPAAPVISLPKGGGAIRGMGEKFAANPVTGTGSLSVTLAASSGRFNPQLSLSYDSGAGNGPLGLGWNLSLPAITRKTDKGLPQYRDAEESDVYILSGAEDLVPVLQPDGSRFQDGTTVPGYIIHRYRPRIEGLFSRIERWTHAATGEIHWRSISRDNVTTLYGQTNESRIFDPEDPDPKHPTRIFSWLICQSYDDKGNAIVYEYQREDSQCVFEDQKGRFAASAHERNRTPASRSANRYLKRVRYGNRQPNRDLVTWQAFDPTQLPADTWMFEVIFDYGEGHYAEEAPDAQGQVFALARIDPPAGSHWPVRQDSFSTYRAGFEVRTYRLCRRVLMFHHFPQELGIHDCLVRSTEFTYSESPIASFLTGITQSGYVRRPAPNQPNRYLKKSLPPLEFEYSPVPDAEALAQQPIREVDSESLENLPVGLDGANYQWIDLDGEGASGIFTEQAGGWYYKRNLSADNLVSENGHQRAAARFGPTEVVSPRPAADLAAGGQFLDLAGDYQLDLVQMEGAVQGFYERTDDADWSPFRPFPSWPNRDMHDPDLRFVDLTGDGLADILITEEEALTWHPSLAKEGFGPAVRVRLPLDEEKGPRTIFDDGTDSIYLADLSGDGLSDLVRIRNGEVCYWPNLGYGRFGAKVMMDNAPRFDNADQFDPQRIRLADTDGSGTTDILYLGREGVQIYFNQSGNRWSDAVALPQFPAIDDLSSVQAVDLLGNGTACLVWSSPLPDAARRPMRYLALMEEKPHLLIGVNNNLGAQTRVHYAPSTRFYLEDKRVGKPWATRLPFPVHVVERIEIYDRISRNRFLTRFAYHHGYFDGFEREFRGFGLVEQWDTEEFAALTASGALSRSENLDAASHVPPVLTKTWFHTGFYLDRGHISRLFESEYYREPGLTSAQFRALLLPDTMLPAGRTPDEEREACRALKGLMLRQEVYALDGTDREPHPYTIGEQNFTLKRLQPRGDNRHAVFFPHAREAITYHYERSPADPRIQHALTLEVDRFGNVLKSAVIGYGRRGTDTQLSDEDQEQQARALITYAENRVTNAIDAANDYRTPLPAETRTYELTGFKPGNNAARFSFEVWTRDSFALPASAVEIPYERQADNVSRQKRLIDQRRTLYRKDDLTALLSLGRLESRAIAGESYKLAFTPGLLAQVCRRGGQALLPNPAGVLGGQGGDRGGYVDLDGNGHWWIPSGRVFLSPGSSDTAAQELEYARRHFFLPHRYRDPFHTPQVPTESIVTYDGHDLLLLETRDPLGNRVTVGERRPDGSIDAGKPGNDYRVLQPCLVMDANRNRSAAAFDALGMVTGTAVMGKPEEDLGDTLASFEADLTEAAVRDHLADPLADPHAILGGATTRLVYDLFAYRRTQGQPNPEPSVVYTLARETHAADLAPGQKTKIQPRFSYSDGFGREIQKKIQVEPGPVPTRDADGEITVGTDGRPVMTANDVAPRWVGSGWTVFNNKGKPVRQYEPFFTDTHRFEFDVRIGVSPVLCYDPVGRVVATLHPDHTWEKVVFDPWRQETWDVNDTVLTADPRTDADVGDFFRRLPEADYLPTWHAQRQGGAQGAQEQEAARKAAIHAATPTVACADTLGRTFLTVAHNKLKYSNTLPTEPPVEEFHRTRIRFDIEGNQRELVDARGRVVMRYDYDLLGNRIHQASMEAGERWMLDDAAGKPLYAWDSRDHRFRTAYDPLRRPTASFLREGAGAELLVGRTDYGETRPNPEASNQRGKAVQVYDQAGVVISDAYDFKGNLLHMQRQLAQDYKSTLDWSAAVPLEAETYTSRTRYDALNRPIQVIAPHSGGPGTGVNVIQPLYNEANLLEQVHAWLNQSAEPAERLDPNTASLHAVANIDYNARGQRERIEYGNGARTTYEYDPNTFRLARMKTTRASDRARLQDLRYTYDPAGNIIHIRDEAQQTIFCRNKRVEPSADYTYDAIYRLIEATGREHLGQVGGAPIPPSYNDAPRIGLPHPNDGGAMGTYLERYVYDAVGNFLEMQHRGSDPASPGWKRRYAYNEASLLEPGQQSNRLSSTTIGGITETYSADGNGYDAHGNMLRMPHLQEMQWDSKDQLQMTRRQAVNAEDTDGLSHQGERTYYVYDAAGQRVRKVTELGTGQVKDARIYLGGFEIYRKNGVNPLVRETLHLMDGKQRIALVETRTEGSDPAPQQLTRYQLGNHLGSVSLELDDQAQILSYEEYTPYGSTSYQAVRSRTETPKRYRYTGKERDEESGFDYHGKRYYVPWLGRWASIDPAIVSAIGGQRFDQPYQYAENRPLVALDPDGGIIWFAVAAIVVIATVTIESDANAPANEEEARRAKPSISEGEFAARTAMIGVSFFAGAGTGGAILRGTGSKVLAGIGGGGFGGLIGAPGDLLVSDLFRWDMSSGAEYGARALGGLVGGGGARGSFRPWLSHYFWPCSSAYQRRLVRLVRRWRTSHWRWRTSHWRWRTATGQQPAGKHRK
ncbi:MAG TPA: SpvB/TcaC N-terminal domain-containing protein [Chthonomonadaceae bacterium]|nr:SpvB/TcaC N-terminal domain-containing protein [Chthonomonadaceae bacterium]HZT40952.1 SpvB/TcaC N-terminal domain-containing protein [Chthonomonadaceae bacterium]